MTICPHDGVRYWVLDIGSLQGFDIQVTHSGFL